MRISPLNRLRRYRWYLLGRWKIKKQIKRKSPEEKLKIILGAGPTVYEGWISTDIPHFNILKEQDWQFFFNDRQIDNLLVEHVLEHLTKEEVVYVLALAYKYLKPGGCLRIAVPDGYHPDPDYIKTVIPPADGHQSIWNIDTIQKILFNNNFQTDPLEYYSDKGLFSIKDFDLINGTIYRRRIKGFISLILDAYKY